MAIEVTRRGYGVARVQVAICSADVNVGLTPDVQALSAVNVIGTPETASIQKPQSTTTIAAPELRRGSGLFLDDALNVTPGIRMERRSMSGGQRIIVRGYSNDRDAGNFIGTGYKAYLNGIPLTDAEGQTVLDDVDFASLGRVDIIRGPASSIYGSGIGGVVNMYTADQSRPGTSIAQNTTAGNDGLLRSDTKLRYAGDRSDVTLAYGHQTYDSYRVASESKKDFGMFLGDFRVSDRQRVSSYLSYANSRDDRAGELDSAKFARRLNAGEDKYIKNHARSVVESVRGGVTQTYSISGNTQNVSTIFFNGSDMEDVYAAGLNWKVNQNFGLRTTFNTDFVVGARALHGVTGGEFLKTNRTAQGYGMTNSVLGGLRSDVETHNTQSNIFTQWDLALPAQVTLTAGASVNMLEYDIVDRLANSANPTHKSASGRKRFDPVVTPRVALNKVFGDNVSVYANVSQGYSPPTADDAVIPYTGEPNASLKSERATQYEVGAKGVLRDGRLVYQAALFDMRVTNKLSKQGVFDTDGTVLYSYTVNAGDQDDRGLEVSASYALVRSQTRALSLVRPFVTFTHSEFTYKGYKSDNDNNARTVDFTGKHVVGVAPNVFNAGVDVESRPGLYANMTYHHTDQEPISYDNAHKAVAFSLLGAKIGYARAVGSRARFDAFVGGDNLTNSLYFTQVFLNHKFDSPVPPNMYLPGPYTAKYYAGLKLVYGM